MATRKRSATKETWVAVSGGFDPLHIGHIRMFKEAKKLGDRLVVIVNNDNWLRLKKGFVFMPEHERVELISSFNFVDKVVLTDHTRKDKDMSVAGALRAIKPTIFANGGDRTHKSTPEDALCIERGIKRAYGVGRGGKVQSSSWMIRDAVKGIMRSVRPWGEFMSWDSGPGWFLKTIHVKPRQRLSLQYHHHRSECWILVEGDAIATLRDEKGTDTEYILKKGEMFTIGKGDVHRLSSKKGGVVVEIAYGKFDEEDIVRLHDDHGRI